MSTVCTAEISSKTFWPEGPKIFGDQNICAGNQILKLRSQLAPRIFFLKSSPAMAPNLTSTVAILTTVLAPLPPPEGNSIYL